MPKRLPSLPSSSCDRMLIGTSARNSTPFDRIPLLNQICAQGAGDRGEQHVVQRAVERLADGLDFSQRHRFGPGHAFRATGLALEARRGIDRHHEQGGQFVGDADAVLAVIDDLPRIQEQIEILEPGARAEIDRRDHGLGHGFDNLAPGVVLVVEPGRLRHCRFGRIGRVAGERVYDADQRDAVGDGMVDAHDQRGTASVLLDEVIAPQRPTMVERRGNEFGREFLQFLLVALAGQGRAVQMVIDIEVFVVFPPGPGDFLHCALAKAPVGQQAAFDGALQTVEVESGCRKS